MDVNEVVTPIIKRIMEDSTLEELNGEKVMAIKGRRKPEGFKNPIFTVNVFTAPWDEDGKLVEGTIQIKYYCDDYRSGNANVEKIGPVMKRLAWMFDDNPPELKDALWYSLWAQETLSPLADAQERDTGEHFGLLQLGYGIRLG